MSDDKFAEWLKQLNEHATKQGQVGILSDQTGAECWRLYFDEGLDPEEAYLEDCSYADAD